MKVNWIVEHFAIESYMEDVMSFIKSNDDNLIYLKPFQYFKTDFTAIDSSIPTVGLCTLQLAAYIKHNYRNLIPGVYYDSKVFDVNNYYKNYYNFLLNKEYVCMPVWAVEKNIHLLSQFQSSNCVFVRPNSGNKSFTGFVDDLDKVVDNIKKSSYTEEYENELVCISYPRNIVAEWRIIIIDGAVVSGSQYSPEKDGYVPDNVISFANSVVSSVDSPPMSSYTMDVCETAAGEYAIVELNSMSCSGLYKSNIHNVMTALRNKAMKDFRHYKLMEIEDGT